MHRQLDEKTLVNGQISPDDVQALKELGNDPEGNAVKVMKGRYGPYVTDGSTNATIHEGDDPEQVTLEQALALIADRIAKGGGKPKKKKAVAKKAAAKPAVKAPKKTAANKTAPKKKAAVKAKPKAEPVAGE